MSIKYTRPNIVDYEYYVSLFPLADGDKTRQKENIEKWILTAQDYINALTGGLAYKTYEIWEQKETANIITQEERQRANDLQTAICLYVEVSIQTGHFFTNMNGAVQGAQSFNINASSDNANIEKTRLDIIILLTQSGLYQTISYSDDKNEVIAPREYDLTKLIETLSSYFIKLDGTNKITPNSTFDWAGSILKTISGIQGAMETTKPILSNFRLENCEISGIEKVSFSDITGQPTDNANLKTELNKKVNLVGNNILNGNNVFEKDTYFSGGTNETIYGILGKQNQLINNVGTDGLKIQTRNENGTLEPFIATKDEDAATKKYVDSKAPTAPTFKDITGNPKDNNKLNLELGAKADTSFVIGEINLITTEMDKKINVKADTTYVDSEIAKNKVSVGDGLEIANNKIDINLAVPSSLIKTSSGLKVDGTSFVGAKSGQKQTVYADITHQGLNIFNGQIKVPTPTDFDDAATMRYVDEHSGGGVDILPLDNTFTGENTFKKKVSFDNDTKFIGLSMFYNGLTSQGEVWFLNNFNDQYPLLYLSPQQKRAAFTITDEQYSEVTIDKKVGDIATPYVGDKPNQVSTIKATKLWSSNTEIESGVVAIENFLPGQRVGISNTWTIPTSDPSFTKINTILNNGGHVEFYMNNKTLPNIVVYHSQTNKEEIMNYNIATFEGAVDCVLTLYRHDNAVCTELNLRSGFIGGTIQISNDHPRARIFGMTGYMSVTSGIASISLFGQGNCNAVSSAKNFYNIDFVDNTQLSTRAFPDGQQAPSLFNVPWKGFIGK